MFGMGFFEILMVAVVAIIFLGPEKLPKALVDMAKFFRAVKKTMEDAKESLDKEINLSKIKEEALAYKNSIAQGAQNLTKELDLKTLDLDENLLEDSNTQTQQIAQQTPQNPQTLQKDSTNASTAQNAESTMQTSLQTSPQTQKNSNTQTQTIREVKLNVSNKTALSFGENLKKHKES
ncbi:Sec-independent protein translocase protein TatB [Helicobacter turcicus]|uniref:Sec-independent protein translocase protein TatB homolog n=1 Tax=Helicobacter turcicus TaxID=2867412 RepID=A0ABS7JNH0_9HELI|nr:Sec-independent protein translocase protein TatB [Helicobacter turcicus]MBX7490909.1 Sec-independent protein translocase protein TatB [Helicobacter turcicus]MBX7545763.1 Sec-independent protein translocase protein TatB [Helicobacter turcicus]